VTLRVLVADDQEIVRTGLAMLLNSRPGIEVVGVAANGQEAVTLARSVHPDVCLLDIRMPILDGIEATRRLHPIPVVVITTFDLDEHVFAALQAGARGFLLKEAGAELLDQAVRAAASGDALIAPSVTARLLGTFATGKARREPLEPLTDREQEVLGVVARGRTNQEIAAELFICLSTVKTHIACLMVKLPARNRVEIAMWAYENGRV